MYKKTARAVGVLFIIATVASIASGSIVQSIIDSPEKLINVSANADLMILAVLLLLALATSVVLIPAALFPVLKRHDEKLALGYFGARILEALTPIVDAICILLLISLSQEYVKTGELNAFYFQTTGGLLLAARSWAFMLNPILFGFGALILYHLLYKVNLIPRWLSVWGFIGAGMVLAAGIMGMFGNFIILLAFPILVQEMVMAAWLIVKGFNRIK